MMFAKGEQIKMKKLISIAMLLAVFILIFSACSPADDAKSGYLPMTAYICAAEAEGSAAAGEKVAASRTYSYLSSEDIPMPQSATLSASVLGNSYTANYESKNIRAVFEPTYTYKTANGDKITVDQSGNVVVFETARYASLFHSAVDTSNCLTPEEALAKATEYLSEIFGAQLAAEYTGELPDVWANSIRVRFRRTETGFDSYSVVDKIVIKIGASDGEFLSYEAYNVGKYDGKKLPDGFDDNKIIEIIKNSLTDRTKTIELSDETKKLIILSDGRLACSTYFRITDNGSASEWTGVIIPLE